MTRSFSLRQRRLAALTAYVLLCTTACGAPSIPSTTTLATATTAPAESAAAVVSTATVASPTTALTATPPATPTAAFTATPRATPTPPATPSPTVAPALATATAQANLPPLDPELAGELQRILDETIADGFIPGATLAVTIPGRQPWAGASGSAARGEGPLDPDTRVRIASISKIFTAVLILQLVEEGKLDLDAPVATWLPDLVPLADRISVRNLLNHTSGLYDYLEDRTFAGQAYADPTRSWAPAELVGYAARFKLRFPPGTPGNWDYSSTNYVMLGMIIEQVTGNTLAQELRQRIFEPLALEQTYSPPEETIQGIQARGYSRNLDQTDISMSFVFATAQIVSTPSDIQRFAQALFGGQLLRPETLRLMYSFENGQGQYNMPDLEYGLGVMRNRLPVGPDANGTQRASEVRTVLGHIGGFGGFRSALWYAPESGIVLALGVNQGATDPNILATRVFDAILTAQER